MQFRSARTALRFLGPAAATFLVAIVAHAKLARTGDALVSFHATGPGGLSIVGTTNELAVAQTDTDVVVTVPLAKLDTKIELRNRHMRDKYLEVAKYPNAELRVARASVQAASGQATGQLTIHGKTKPVTFTYATKPEGGATAVTGSAPIVMSDFGIEKPGYSGISVKPEMSIEVTFRVTKD